MIGRTESDNGEVLFLYFAFKTKEVVTKEPSISYRPGSKIGR